MSKARTKTTKARVLAYAKKQEKEKTKRLVLELKKAILAINGGRLKTAAKNVMKVAREIVPSTFIEISGGTFQGATGPAEALIELIDWDDLRAGAAQTLESMTADGRAFLVEKYPEEYAKLEHQAMHERGEEHEHTSTLDDIEDVAPDNENTRPDNPLVDVALDAATPVIHD